MTGFCLRMALPADAVDFMEIQNAAFYRDFVEFGECPGYGRTVNDLTKSMENNETWAIMYEKRVAGKLSLKCEGESAHIGCLCIAPDFQRKGLGRRAMEEIERLYPDVRIWRLETPKARNGNIRFYEALGYRVTGGIIGGTELVRMEKTSR